VAAQKGLPDYIIWGVIDWHFRHQRPQQLARTIAESGRRVFYISSDFRDDTRAGFDIEQLDAGGRLFQVKLYLKKPPTIYFVAPTNEVIRQLRASIGRLLDWAAVCSVVSFVQHSFWYDIARVMPDSRLIYDCIDHHEGFGNNSNAIISLEHQLFEKADLTVTTSGWLDQLASKYSRQRILIRNACDFEHFSHKPQTIYEDSKRRRIIGYYGAIANWFDQDLVEAVAIHFSDCCLLLVGADTVRAQERLGHLKNVVFLGEVEYSELPYYLHAFDVAILPFRINPLTLATNPVKVYEYLAAGKPVVSVRLPEVVAFDQLISTANSTEDFIGALDTILENKSTEREVQIRKQFASQQTWRHRTELLIDRAENSSVDPLISVIVITHNNLDFTRACLSSIELYSNYENLELIVVDNASSDGSKDFLKQWLQNGPNRKLVLNEENKGFAAANNQGLLIAKGEYLVMLNNDTYVTPGWVRTLFRHLKFDPTIGLIGPVTNNIGNEARIDVTYKNMDEMLKVSTKFTHEHLGEAFDIGTVAFFCVMMPQSVFKIVGPLDEAFGLGFFEDDDYCKRVEQIGLRVVCAEDVFIHHHLSASFSKLDRDARRALFDTNKSRYERKWGRWTPHSPRREKFGSRN
jgi:GT2 family glycosyltransferase/glycosyltransferase involved in cell wall biosynthesis